MLQRLLAAVLGLLFLVAVFLFTTIALGVLLALGLVGWAWIAWRSRAAKRGAVIEGEFRDETPLQRVEDLERR